ncbi:MAG: hypothetical protein M1833_004266 [Piccolia ochrophora]|nr:MAG: hypothetical protein M1833_004266 [Piccolia ochrophora]
MATILNCSFVYTSKLKVEREKFRKRRKTLYAKACQISQLCDADVYVLVRKNDRFYEFSSKDDLSWPPPKEKIENHYPLTVRHTPGSLKDEHSHRNIPNKDAPVTEGQLPLRFNIPAPPVVVISPLKEKIMEFPDDRSLVPTQRF